MPWLLGLSGWAWTAFTYVAGSARQSDLDALQAEVETLKAAQVSTESCDDNPKQVSCTAINEARRCLAAHERTAVTLRTLVGEIARLKVGKASPNVLANVQQAAEDRYDREMKDGATPASAARTAIEYALH